MWPFKRKKNENDNKDDESEVSGALTSTEDRSAMMAVGDLLNLDQYSGAGAGAGGLNLYMDEMGDNVEFDDEIDLTDFDENDAALNAALDNLDQSGDLMSFYSNQDGNQLNEEEMSLLDEFEKEQTGGGLADSAVLSELQRKVTNMEKQLLELKKQAFAARKKNNTPLALELMRKAKILEKELEGSKEELEMLTAHVGDNDDEDLLDMSMDINDDPVSSNGVVPDYDITQRFASSLRSSTVRKANSRGASVSSTNMSKSNQSISSKSKSPTSVDTQIRKALPRPSSASSIVSELTDFTSTLPSTCSVNDQVFIHLEGAMIEALKLYLAEAKSLKDSDKQKATKKIKQYKALKSEMGVLLSRKALPYLVSPPLFRWNTIEQKYFHQELSLADTDLKLDIQSVHNIESLLKDHGSHRYLEITYSSEFLNNDKKPLNVVPTARKDGYIKYKYPHKSALVNFETIIHFRRNSSCSNQFKRRKIILCLSLTRGMFQSSIALGQVKLPLEDLLEKCSTGGDIPITDVAGKRGVGGFIRVFASVRNPINKPNGEVRVSVDRELVIGPWPEISVPRVLSSELISNQATRIPHPTSTTANSVASQQSTKTVDFSCLSEEEKRDPLNVNWLLSNDVLTAEHEVLEAEEARVTASIASLRSGKVKGEATDEQIENLEVTLMNLEGNRNVIETKLYVLSQQVQSGALSIEVYLAKVQERLEKDKKLAVFCNQAGDKESAVRLMQRIRIMQSEIATAQEVHDKPDDSSIIESSDDSSAKTTSHAASKLEVGTNSNSIPISANEVKSSVLQTGDIKPAATSQQSTKTVDFSCLSEEEKRDPLNVNWLLSNDVLTAEHEVLEADLARLTGEITSLRSVKKVKGESVDEQIDDLELRMMTVEGRHTVVGLKLSILVQQVQSGALSLEVYLAKVQERLENDKKLAVFCNQAGDKESAVRIMQRIRIMQSEIATAHEAQCS